MDLANLRTAPCANIASKDPMVDSDGRVLAAEIFGWKEPGERWWERPRLALTSPLTQACRYESEPFWCNRSGIHTQQCNPHLVDLDLTDFFERAMTEVAIVSYCRTGIARALDRLGDPARGGDVVFLDQHAARKAHAMAVASARLDAEVA